jgi:hypothetical protein
MSFEDRIQQWVILDNQQRALADKSRNIREQKNNVEAVIIKHVETHHLTNNFVKISDGKIKFANVKQTQPLTLKYVEDCLAKCIKNEGQVKMLMEYIKDARVSKQTMDIKRFYANN